MFSTLSGFSVFFFTVGALLLAGILFEEKFLQIEDRIDGYFKKKKLGKRQKQIREFRTQKSQNKKMQSCSTVNKRTTRNYAA